MKTLALGVVSALALVSTAFAGDHSDLMREVHSYKPFGAFNLVVGDTRFSGFFIPGPERCDVDLKQTLADETSLTPPRRLKLQIAAGGRNQLDAGPDAALAIACTDDARMLKLAPQGRLNAARL